MVHLSFEPNAGMRAHWCTPELLSDPPVVIVHSAFELEVRLRVGGVEIFEHEWPPGRETQTFVLPLMHVAIKGLAVVRAAPRLGSARYDFPEIGDYLLFQMDSEVVRVTWTYNEASASVPYTELLEAWEQFRDDVRAYLNRECPELRAMPYFRRWLQGEEAGVPPTS